MRNLCVLFMASAFLTSVGCSPTSVSQGEPDPTSPAQQSAEDSRDLNNEETLMDRAEALLKDGKFLPAEWKDEDQIQYFDTPFEISFDDEGQISNIATTGLTQHSYPSDNSILKDNAQIFVPIWWNENTSSDVVVFLVKRDDNGISGEVHEISSDMMKVLYAASFTEESLDDLGYQYANNVKAVFEIAAEDIQASSTVQHSSSNLIYAVSSDDGIKLRLLSETEEIANIKADADKAQAALRAKAAQTSQELQNAEDARAEQPELQTFSLIETGTAPEVSLQGVVDEVNHNQVKATADAMLQQKLSEEEALFGN